MDNYSTNGLTAQLAEFETPFSDIAIAREERQEMEGNSQFGNQFFSELEGPFTQNFESINSESESNPLAGEFVQLVAELNDKEFTDNLYNMAAELEDSWSSKISNEAAMSERYVPFITQEANQYFAPLISETEKAIDRISEHFSGNNFTDHSEAEIERFFAEFEFSNQHYSPAQEQFFGSILKKVKSVINTGVNLAKKGISIVGKIIPIGPILRKLKGMIRPLLNKVLKFAIGKLPKTLQPYAQNLANKFLNLEETEGYTDENETTTELESIQTEFDNHLAKMVLSGNESEAETIVSEYEGSSDVLQREMNYETGGLNVPSLEIARKQFIDDLGNLKQGESAAPAIERFLPVILALRPVIKIAISIIGRQKVIDFLAGLLARLVAKYVPAEVVRPLATNIIDVGMTAIGFETYEIQKPDVGYEAIANTIQETIQNLEGLNEETISDRESFTASVLEAFETAAVNNFPPQYIRKDLSPSTVPGTWVMKPRRGPRFMYKKFTHVFSVTIHPKVARSIKSFGGFPLSGFLKDSLGLDITKPIQAKVHLYEAINGTLLSQIGNNDKAPGLSVPSGYVQLHPLSMCTAAMLIKEPCLGKDVSANFTVTRNRVGVGQRFYYLEIAGAHLKYIPGIGPKPSGSNDIQGVINFLKGEIRINYFFSEQDAKDVVEKLNKNDYLGATLKIRSDVHNVLQSILLQNVPSKVKIIHEALPELYLENYNDHQEQFAPLAAVGRVILEKGKEELIKIVTQLVLKLVQVAGQALINYFKARAAEFKQAQAQPADGVTVKIIWVNVPGLSKIAAIINAIKGKLSLGNVLDFVLPSIPTPVIEIKAGKHFD